MSKVGSKGLYKEWLTPEKLTLLEGWARDGLSDQQIAKNIRIHIATLYTWKKKYSEIDEALRKGKEVVDFEVENALLKRALGFKEIERKKTVMPDGTEKIELSEKYFPPDTTAIIMWLNNRRPDKYRRNWNKETLDEERLKQQKKVDEVKHWIPSEAKDE